MSSKPTQADVLVELAADTELWHTPGGDPYVTLPVGEHVEHHSIRSRRFRNWLAREYHSATGSTLSAPGAMASALSTLAGRAEIEGAAHEVHVRVSGLAGDRYYLDLCDVTWRVIEITADGWRVVDARDAAARTRTPSMPEGWDLIRGGGSVRFRRAPGMLALPEPERGGSLNELRGLVNVASDEDYALLVGWLLAALRYDGPYPVLIVQGEQGSAKSTTSRVLRRLIDPNSADLRAQPREPRDLAIAANNARLVALDNMPTVTDWCSDALCRLATGGGFVVRALYTDAEECIFAATRPILANGIDSVATRGDLLDRAIVLQLPRLAEMRPERELWSEFERARPRILGALLDASVAALRGEHGVVCDTRVRMLDATRWVTAAEAALPWAAGRFAETYAANRADATELALEASPVAAEVRQLVAAVGKWEGTAGELLAVLDGRAPERTRRLRSWPTTARSLSSALRRLAPALREAGVETEHWREANSRRRMIRLRASGNDRPHRPHGPQARYSDDLAGDDPGTHPDETEFASPDRPHVTHGKGNGKDDGDDGDAKIPTCDDDHEEGWL